MNLVFILISSASTFLIAIFTILLYKITRAQHRFNYEQELQLHSSWHSTPPDRKVHYTIVIVNPNRTPVVIENIDERENDQPLQPAQLEFEIPPECPERIYIVSFPWVISGQGFGIWSRAYKVLKNSGKIAIAIIYHDYRKRKLAYKRISISYRCPFRETKGVIKG